MIDYHDLDITEALKEVLELWDKIHGKFFNQKEELVLIKNTINKNNKEDAEQLSSEQTRKNIIDCIKISEKISIEKNAHLKIAAIDLIITILRINPDQYEFSNLKKSIIEKSHCFFALFDIFYSLRAFEKTTNLLTNELDRVKKNVNTQALTEKIYNQSIKIEEEYNNFKESFNRGIFSLQMLAFLMVSASFYMLHIEMSEKNNNPFFWKVFLYLIIPISAPFIWKGWFLAKRIITIEKILHDYRFKLINLYTYEGYRKETLGSEDHEMQKILLDSTIKSFSENPVRLYQETKENHGHPIEAAWSQLNKKGASKAIDSLKNLIESIKK